MLRRADTLIAMSWWEYMGSVTDHAPAAQVARRIGVDQSTVNLWKTRTPRPQVVALFARSYGRPVLEAFIAAGFLTEEEARQRPTAAIDPAQLSDDQLIAEVTRRIKGDGAQKTSPAAGAVPAEPEPAAESLAEGPRGRLTRKQQEVKKQRQTKDVGHQPSRDR